MNSNIQKTLQKPKNTNINLFLVGTGLIGSTLLKHIAKSTAPIQIVGLANSRTMLIDSHHIPIKNWKKKLSQGTPMKLQKFVKQMTALKISHKIFVDCTASENVAREYENIIKAGIAIVTPNKKAHSGPFENYQKLKNLCQKTHVPLLYDATVGAGLPILRTIRNLLISGDEIIKIEAVLSGTLSYIFNKFSKKNMPLSQIIRQAQLAGYTEPDPRDDLSGMDVARKMLIIAREIGHQLEIHHIQIKPIMPAHCLKTHSDFWRDLKKYDHFFEKKKRQAEKKSKTLRHIATLHNGKAKIALREVSQNHSFYHLSDADNIIALRTKRYNQTPLVIKGPGAGAEITAGNVLTNILSIF